MAMARGRRTVPESQTARPRPRIIIADYFSADMWKLFIPAINTPPGRRFLLPLVLFVPGLSLALAVPRMLLASMRPSAHEPTDPVTMHFLLLLSFAPFSWTHDGVRRLPVAPSSSRPPSRHQRPQNGRRDQQFSPSCRGRAPSILQTPQFPIFSGRLARRRPCGRVGL